LAEAKRLFEAWIEALQAWGGSPSEATEAEAAHRQAVLQSHLGAHMGAAALTPVREAVADILRQLGLSDGQESDSGN
jgi:hypothetical protein